MPHVTVFKKETGFTPSYFVEQLKAFEYKATIMKFPFSFCAVQICFSFNSTENRSPSAQIPIKIIENHFHIHLFFHWEQM